MPTIWILGRLARLLSDISSGHGVSVSSGRFGGSSTRWGSILVPGHGTHRASG